MEKVCIYALIYKKKIIRQRLRIYVMKVNFCISRKNKKQ